MYDFRPATAADTERLAKAVIDGFEGYRSFAPDGWTPPSLAGEIEGLRPLLGDEQVWCVVAEADGRLAGQITVLPAARAVHPVRDPALAHLRNLFVHPDFWGSGLATALHAAAVETARERGFAEMRLFTAAGQAHPVRARALSVRRVRCVTPTDHATSSNGDDARSSRKASRSALG